MIDASTAAALTSFAQSINAVVSSASRGIGLALVERLLDEPAVDRVFAAARHGASDEKLAQLAANDDTRLHRLDMDVSVGSIGDNRLGGWYGYRGSKAAQNMITRNLAIELRRRGRGIICVALHPGTVDTGLSRPFQGNVPADRLFTPDQAARQLLKVIDGLRAEDNDEFFAWDGQSVPL